MTPTRFISIAIPTHPKSPNLLENCPGQIYQIDPNGDDLEFIRRAAKATKGSRVSLGIRCPVCQEVIPITLRLRRWYLL